MKRRLRKLYVDGREFVWTSQIYYISGTDRHRCIRVRVWGAGKNSQVLQADLVSKAVLPWGCATDDSYPTPKDVRTVIDYALTHGWDPDLIRGTYFLSESEHASAFELADFLLTDRLRDEGAPDPTTRVFRAFDEFRDPLIPAPSVKPSPTDSSGPAAPAPLGQPSAQYSDGGSSNSGYSTQ